MKERKEEKEEERKGKEKGREREKELAFIESILGANCVSCWLSLTSRVTYTSSEILYTYYHMKDCHIHIK